MIRWIAVIFLVVSVTDFGQCFKFGIEDSSYNRFDKIANYVGALIKDCNEKNSEKTNDVSLIQFFKYPDDRYIERILMKIPKENAILMPQLEKKIQSQHIRTAAFVIMIADNFNVVRFRSILG